MGASLSNTYGCCTSRRAAARCSNYQLNSRLDQLAKGGEEFEEVWLLCPNRPCVEAESSSSGKRGSQKVTECYSPIRPHSEYTIVYMYGKEDGLSPLSIEWRMDGLGFVDGAPLCATGGTPLGDHASFREVAGQKGSRLKVFHAPMDPKKLMKCLLELEAFQYDPNKFNSKHFCERLFELQDGETVVH
mmetsp:Transcript_18925/g.42396  ORF Transcript_18925/g.42396 Transcript_18925/m.42396 type:complete len:188 (+) Transcript_18925:49-612(+)